MKPEVTRIFEDLEAWHDHCRFNLLPFNPSDLYRSKEYRYFQKSQSGKSNRDYRDRSHNKDRSDAKFSNNQDRKSYIKKN